MNPVLSPFSPLSNQVPRDGDKKGRARAKSKEKGAFFLSFDFPLWDRRERKEKRFPPPPPASPNLTYKAWREERGGREKDSSREREK